MKILVFNTNPQYAQVVETFYGNQEPEGRKYNEVPRRLRLYGPEYILSNILLTIHYEVSFTQTHAICIDFFKFGINLSE